MDRSGRTHRRTTGREIAAAIGVVLTGAAVVTAIVTVDPRWRAIIAATRAPWAASVGLGTPGLASWRPATVPRIAPGSAPSPGFESPVAVSAQPAEPALPRPAATAPKPPRSKDSTRSGANAPGIDRDTRQVMVNLLVAQLGPDPALRAALANAAAHEPDSPEFTFWHQVAAAIQEGAARLRP
jgi:hypothetical protein